MIMLMQVTFALLSMILAAPERAASKPSVLFQKNVGTWALVMYCCEPEAPPGAVPVAAVQYVASFQKKDGPPVGEIWSRWRPVGGAPIVFRQAELLVEPTRQCAMIAYLIDDQLWLTFASLKQTPGERKPSDTTLSHTSIETPVLRLNALIGKPNHIRLIELTFAGERDDLVAKARVVLEDADAARTTDLRWILMPRDPESTWRPE